MVCLLEDHVQEVWEGTRNTPRISELDFKNTRRFQILSEKEVLYPIIDAHDVIVVAGAFFGDEGKGKTVAGIAYHPDIGIIVRTNSGENAGHTVYDEHGNKFVFHLAPSGLLLPDKINGIGPNCVMDPISFMRTEISQLVEHGVDYSNLFVDNVHIVTPYHKLLDALGPANSSTVKGMSPVHSSKVTKKGLRLDDLFNSEDVQRSRLEKDMETYQGILLQKGLDDEALIEKCHEINSDGIERVPDYIFEFLETRDEDKVDFLIDMYRREVVENPAFPKRGDVVGLIRDTLKKGKKVLCEGPQSGPLSNMFKQHSRSSTAADTTSAGIKAAGGYNVEKYTSVTLNIHKNPSPSRVGIGSNPTGYVKQDFFSSRNLQSLKDLEGACDDFDAIQKIFMDSVQENGILEPVTYEDDFGEYTIGAAMAIASSKQHGEFGATTKKPRVCGLFDCVLQYEMNELQGPYLSISAMDRGDDYDKVGLAIAYVFFDPSGESKSDSSGTYSNGDIIKAGDTLPSEIVLEHCYPIIKLMDGWKNTPIAKGVRDEEDPLPQTVQDYIGAVQHYTGNTVISIGNGRNTPDLLYIGEDDGQLELFSRKESNLL